MFNSPHDLLPRCFDICFQSKPVNFFSICQCLKRSLLSRINLLIEIKQKEKFKREKDARLTDVIEIKALIGLLYLAGSYGINRIDTMDLWDTTGHGVDYFGSVMFKKIFFSFKMFAI